MEKRSFPGFRQIGLIAGASLVLMAGGILGAPSLALEVKAAGSVSVTDYGAVPDDGIDDTDAFNAAIDAVASDDSLDTVTVPSGRWNINTTTDGRIRLKSRMNLIMDQNAILEVAGTSASSYGVIQVHSVQDVVISGGKIEGERDKHSGTGGESGHGIRVIDSNYVTISNMEISSNWGDGIYLGTSSDNDGVYGCNGITISGCRITDNRRSNISIVDANDVTIDGCYLANAYGTAPQAGINIEPNAKSDHTIPDDRICKRIKILNTTVDVHDNITGDRDGQFMGFMTHYYPDDQTVYTAYDLQISGCTFNGDCGNYSAKKAVISNTSIGGTFYDCYETTLNNVNFSNHDSDENPYANDGRVPQEDPIHQWIDEEKVRDFVKRIYLVALGREAEEDGLQDWVHRLSDEGYNAVDIVRGIMASDEYLSKGKSNEEIVTDCYQAMLGRDPDTSGFNDWTGRLDCGMTVNAIYAGFVGSQEFGNLCNSYGIRPGTYEVSEARDMNQGITLFVNRLYTKALDRNYDVDGLNDWCGRLVGDSSRENVLAVATDGFFHSQEFLNKNLSNEDFVTVCYRTYLGREPEPAGFNDWVGQLDRGEKTRDQVMAGFAYSAEFGDIMAEYGL